MKAWGIAASAGMEAQVRALAEALGLPVEIKNAYVKPAFAWIPNILFAAGLKRFVIPRMIEGHDSLQPPYPDVVISCGRRAAIVAMGFKDMAKEVKFIHIQDPHVSPKHFDMVIAMEHDAIAGDNVIKTEYALHSITADKLGIAAGRFAPRFAEYPRPYVSVLLGGSTNKYTLTEEAMQAVIIQLKAMLESFSGSLLITISRRTGAENIRLLKVVLEGHARAYIYDGEGENPYLGLLALADYMVVSNDSVNMMTEAMATGKPLYILPLEGHKGTKPAKFAEKILRGSAARLWGGHWENWRYAVGNPMLDLARKIRAKGLDFSRISADPDHK